MKKIGILSFFVTLSLLIFSNQVFAAVETKDIKEVKKITKKIIKLSDKNDSSGIEKYFSENYTSFDGYNKKDTIKIFDTTAQLYKNAKSKEKITKIEPFNDDIKVYITETLKNNMDTEGGENTNTEGKIIKGEMISTSDYSLVFTKENGSWLVIRNEIYDETTKILYGEAIKTDFTLETPENIDPGKEYTVKLSITPQEDRYTVGSIGHDKIVWPPEKTFDPYRSINSDGVLERVMIANKDGKNEYANTVFAFITPYVDIKANSSVTEDEIKKAAISGMGIYIKRVNVKKEL